MKILLTFLLLIFLGFPAFAGTAEVDHQIISYDDELSFKNFSNWEFKSRPEYDFSNKTIYASTFSNETPNSDIFPEGTHDVHFIYCHLENVILPPNSVVDNPDCDGSPCWTQPFEVQNDHRDWQLNSKGVPVKVLNEDYWKSQEVSVDPADIPQTEVIVSQGQTLEQVLKSEIPTKKNL